MKQIKLRFLLTVLMSMVGAKSFAHDIEVKNADGVTIYYNYINDGKELEVTFGSSSYSSYMNEYEGNVVIPEEVTYMNRTRKVTSIGDSAFRGCPGLTSVTIGNSVTSIGYSAFRGCSGLTSVTIGNSVTSIGEDAFTGCKNLTSVSIGNSVTSIGNSAFSGCSGLTSVTIPNSVTSIGSEAFSYCKGLTSVTIDNSVTSIGSYAFDGCTGLTSVTIGNSVTSIGERAFYNCSGLTSVTIPNSVTNTGENAFGYCTGLKKVIVKDLAAWCGIKFGMSDSNPLYYAHHLYSDENTEITNLIIPNSVTSIGSYAFRGCSGLTSVTIGNSVTSIGYSAFSGCSGLTSVTIPNSVTSIGTSAFYGCSGLTSITIPNSVTSIGSYAFNGCSGLTSVTIGNSVTSIGSYAFDCENLATVVSLIENPFVINGKSTNFRVFSQNTFMNATLYVPTGKKEAYKATGGWKDFVFIEEGTGGGSGDEPTPGVETCAKPTISYSKGKLTFSSETEGAVCHSTITDADITSYSTNEVDLGVTYNISVYAAKTGWYNSETATATLCWIDQEPKTEGITNGIAQVPALAVLIQTEGGNIRVEGAEDGTLISVYGINGTQMGSAVSENGTANIGTSLQAGNIAIVKVGEKSMKVLVK